MMKSRSNAPQALILYNELTVGPKADRPDLFAQVLNHQGTQVFGVFVDQMLAAMVMLHLLLNVLSNARPYGVIENVVTRKSHQGCGYGRQAMQAAIDAAWAAEALGFSSKDKHAYRLGTLH